MTRHLQGCAAKHDAPAGATGTRVLLRIEDAFNPAYWIYVEMDANAELELLDRFLRQLWLECCGHLSEFVINRSNPSMDTPLSIVIDTKGDVFFYEYDFGSTTALKGQVMGLREAAADEEAVRLLARNNPFDWGCAACDEPATVICPLCVYEDDCLFCDSHAQAHEHADEEFYLPVVNSPRMGVCGYAGDQDQENGL